MKWTNCRRLSIIVWVHVCGRVNVSHIDKVNGIVWVVDFTAKVDRPAKNHNMATGIERLIRMQKDVQRTPLFHDLKQWVIVDGGSNDCNNVLIGYMAYWEPMNRQIHKRTDRANTPTQTLCLDFTRHHMFIIHTHLHTESTPQPSAPSFANTMLYVYHIIFRSLYMPRHTSPEYSI